METKREKKMEKEKEKKEKKEWEAARSTSRGASWFATGNIRVHTRAALLFYRENYRPLLIKS